MNKIILFILLHGYALLFSWSFLAQFGLPLPAAPLFLAAGALAGMGELHLPAIFGVGIFAILLSDFLWYEIGRYRGSRVLSFLCRISLDPDSCVQSSKRIFSRHGTHSLLVSKFIPGMNTLAPPLAGIFRMRRSKFFLFNGLGTVVFVGVFSGIGYLLGEEIDRYSNRILEAGGWIGGILLGFLTAFIFAKFFRRRRLARRLAMPRMGPEMLRNRLARGEDLLIVDVRNDLEVEADPVALPGAFHVPLEQIEKNPQVFPTGRDIILYCS
ncbi:MAG: sulfurtransferase [Deltaproteobacteria bacterium]|nr:MAG: sulfurtransferase [Deltaproteobacteria bacterium]